MMTQNDLIIAYSYSFSASAPLQSGLEKSCRLDYLGAKLHQLSYNHYFKAFLFLNLKNACRFISIFLPENFVE